MEEENKVKDKSISDAIKVFTDIVDFSEKNNIVIPDNVVLLGGVALSHFGVRDDFSDIDAYSESIDSLYSISDVLMDSWKGIYGDDFDIDFTSNKSIWTDKFNIGNLNQCEKIYFIKNKDNEPVMSVSVLDQETIFILKSYADRDKDRSDLEKIFSRSSKEKIISKMNEISLFNKGTQNQLMIEPVLSNIQEISLKLIDENDIIRLKNVDEETLLNISSEFGLEDQLLSALNDDFYQKDIVVGCKKAI